MYYKNWPQTNPCDSQHMHWDRNKDPSMASAAGTVQQTVPEKYRGYILHRANLQASC